jgi:hypothetical protein
MLILKKNKLEKWLVGFIVVSAVLMTGLAIALGFLLVVNLMAWSF